MKRKYFLMAVITLFGIITGTPTAAATAPPVMATPAGLGFSEVKITGDEFLVLKNNSDLALDLGDYWLDDFNSTSPLSAGVSSSSQQLPDMSLGAGQNLLLSAAAMPTCGAAVAGKLNVGLTDSGGFLELVRLDQVADGSVTQTPGDVVSWSSGASGMIPNVPSSTKDPKAVFYRYQSDDGFAWQQADLDPNDSCQLNFVVASGTNPQTIAVTPLAQAATSPPATIVSLAGTGQTAAAGTASLPAVDLGLSAPQVSELLPNPAGTGTDSTNEFIELYNPNGNNFDLSGFSLQVGTTTTHTFTFPGGTFLAAKAFKAFYSSETALTLSNSGGQTQLLDPFGTAIGHSDPYGSAKDGQAWALAKGKWYWTTTSTPGAANIIKQPTSSKKSTSATKKAAGKSTGQVKGASTAGIGDAAGSAEDSLTTPIHTGVLALIAGVALLYGAYEYRRDLANRLRQLRGHFRIGRGTRQ